MTRGGVSDNLGRSRAISGDLDLERSRAISHRYGISPEKLAAWTVEAHGMDAADALQWGRECCVNDTTRGGTGDVALVLEAYVAKRVSREGKPSVGAEPRLSLLTPSPRPPPLLCGPR